MSGQQSSKAAKQHIGPDQAIPPTFTTRRLRVWEMEVSPGGEDLHKPRTVYIACVTDIDWPGVAVSVSIWPAMGNYVEWIQVADVLKGKGYGRELIAALRDRIGAINVSGTTSDGVRLEAWYARTFAQPKPRTKKRRKVGTP